jgi:hypothetical protein
MFPLPPVPRYYKAGQLENWVSCETAAPGKNVSTEAEGIVGICRKATTGTSEVTADWEDTVSALMNCVN